MPNFSIKDENSDHKFFSILQNILSKIKLTAFERSVYWAIKESSGERGSCTKSYAKLAEMSGMGITALKTTIKSLEKPNLVLGKPLIIVKERFTEFGDRDTSEIVLIDLWSDNIKFFQKNIGQSLNDPPQSPRAQGESPRAQGVSRHATDGQSPRDYNKDIKNPMNKNNSPLPPKGGAPLKRRAVSFSIHKILEQVDSEFLSDHQKKKLSKDFSEEQICEALEFADSQEEVDTLFGLIRWYCTQEKKPEKKVSSNEIFEINKKFAYEIPDNQNSMARYEKSSTYCEIIFFANREPLILEYGNEKPDKFAEKLSSSLRAYGLGKINSVAH